MENYSKSKDNESLFSRIDKWRKSRQIKKIAVFVTLIIVSISCLLVAQSKFVFSDNSSSEQPAQTQAPPATSEFSDLPTQESDRLTPQTSLPTAIDEQQPSNSKVGQPLTEQERQTIVQVLGDPSMKTIARTFEQTPKFILHDTSGELSDSAIAQMQQQARGPKGIGVETFVSRTGRVTILRPFFDPRRPTATVYEKAADILPESARNQEMRQVWQRTNKAIRQEALKSAIAGMNLDETSLIRGATLWLESSSEQAFERLKAQSSVSLDGGKTTGVWAITRICDATLSDRDRASRTASSRQTATTLINSCQKLNPVLKETRKRVASSVHVEIVQARGSECMTSDSQVKAYNTNVPDSSQIKENNVVPLQTWERPAYTDEQYQKVSLLYLLAALEAGQFPEITTHYWVDQGKFGKIGTHCDPRGFDLSRLYQTISDTVLHPFDTIYGIQPQYGLYPEQGDNVWWSESVLGGLPPSF